jgi:glycosyltransferase involved in cell wall biosynthesis
MAVGIAAVVSPVGVNREIVEHGINGYHCTKLAEWFDSMEELIADPRKRKEMGIRGREKVLANYSTSANAANFLSLFE